MKILDPYLYPSIKSVIIAHHYKPINKSQEFFYCKIRNNFKQLEAAQWSIIFANILIADFLHLTILRQLITLIQAKIIFETLTDLQIHSKFRWHKIPFLFQNFRQIST